MTDLRPCPFCGGRAKVVSQPLDEPIPSNWSREYDICDEYRVMCEECHSGTAWFCHRDYIMGVWNRRVDE